MRYDPVKNIFASALKKFPSFRIIFYKALDAIFLRSWYVRRELRNIRKLLGVKEINIYDAGTGYGQYSYFMTKKLQPNKILAADIKNDWIKDCKIFFNSRKLNNVNFAVEDLTSINHKNEFDLIICVDVMEHIADDVKVFENFYNGLKPGGYLLINTPSIYGGSDVHSDNDESFIGEHARDGYSYEDLSSKLLPIGFKIHQSKYTYGFWGDKSWRLGIKYPMVMLNMSKLFLFVLPFYYLLTLLFTFLMMYMDYSSTNKKGSGINLIAVK
jgi:2-polyprenyl-3-methyl-5-hydroxy-6-metoxy-1,4-benzoquinol methylase